MSEPVSFGKLWEEITGEKLQGTQRPIDFGHCQECNNIELLTGEEARSNTMTKISREANFHEMYGPAMTIMTQAAATQYFDALVTHIMRFNKLRGGAKTIARNNLAYYAGYYDDETRQRVERLFKCNHPVFGPIASGATSSGEALRAGLRYEYH